MKNIYLGSNLLILRTKKNISQEKLADIVGVKRTTITNYESNLSTPDYEKLILLAKFFDISTDDLLTKQLKNEAGYSKSNIVKESEILYTAKKQKIPLIPIEAIAEFNSTEINDLTNEATHYAIPDFNNKADFLIRISGNSMSPKYVKGDLVACKKIPNESFIRWGNLYLIDTIQGEIFNRLFEGEDDLTIKCVSDNELFPPFKLKKKEIRSLAFVVGGVCLE
jgi:repressor LexA